MLHTPTYQDMLDDAAKCNAAASKRDGQSPNSSAASAHAARVNLVLNFIKSNPGSTSTQIKENAMARGISYSATVNILKKQRAASVLRREIKNRDRQKKVFHVWFFVGSA